MKPGFGLPWIMAALLLALGGCGKSSAPSTTENIPSDSAEAVVSENQFVTVNGKQFLRNGKPYFIVGTNFWFGAYLGSEGGVGDRERLLRELDLLKSTGINNLRVLAASESSELMRSVRPAIVTAPGEFNEDLWVGLDFLLDEMAKRDITAVLYFNNFWQWSGGMSQYVSWFDGTPVIDPDVTNEWNAFMQNSAKFYRMEEAQALYRDVIQRVVTRKNTINGKLYNEDPIIMSWQLANEPRPGSDEEGRLNFPAFKEWVHETSKYIRGLAPRQLISTGNEGSMGTIRDMALFIESHQSEYVDYLTFHMWLKNWGWFDATNPEATYESGLAHAKKYINDHVDVANQMNKPVVLEEFGAERDGGSFEVSSTTVYRDRFYEEFFDLIHARAASGDSLAGSNFWAWGGFGRTDNADFMWQEGDDFVGDPPQEAQGLNAVFDTDASTLEIIKKHAASMKQLQH